MSQGDCEDASVLSAGVAHNTSPISWILSALRKVKHWPMSQRHSFCRYQRNQLQEKLGENETIFRSEIQIGDLKM